MPKSTDQPSRSGQPKSKKKKVDDTIELRKKYDLHFPVKHPIYVLPEKPKEFANDWMLDTDRMNTSGYKEADKISQGTFSVVIYHMHEDDVKEAFPEVTFHQEPILPIEDIILDLKKSQIFLILDIDCNSQSFDESSTLKSCWAKIKQMYDVTSYFGIADRFAVFIKDAKQSSLKQCQKECPETKGKNVSSKLGQTSKTETKFDSTEKKSAKIIEELIVRCAYPDPKITVIVAPEPLKLNKLANDETGKSKREQFLELSEKFVKSSRFTNMYRLLDPNVKKSNNTPNLRSQTKVDVDQPTIASETDSFSLTKHPQDFTYLIKSLARRSANKRYAFNFAPDKETILRLTALREADATGNINTEKQEKIVSETEFFINLIDRINKEVSEKSSSTLFVKNTNKTTMKNIMDVNKREKFEFDWLSISSSQITCVEITSGQSQIPKKIEQFSTHLSKIKLIALAIMDKVELIPPTKLEKWWEEFSNKYLKYLIITTKMSQYEWNEELSNEKSPVAKSIKTLKEKGIDNFEKLFVVTKERGTDLASLGQLRTCDNNKVQLDNSSTGLNEFFQGTLIPNESEMQKLQSQDSGIPNDHKLAIEFIGSVLVSGHLLQYHKLPKQEQDKGYLIPTVVHDFTKQQRDVVEHICQSAPNDVKVRTILMGEGGTGKTYFCFNLFGICLNKLNFERVIYAVPQNKKALREYIDCKMLQEFGYKACKEFKLCTISEVEDNFPKYRSVKSKYALIVDECLASSRDELLKILKPVYGLLPFFDVVVICMSIMGQLECSTEYFDHNTLPGFQRTVLTVGYRSTREIAMFNSHLLHTKTKKHICGTSCSVIPPSTGNESTVKIEYVEKDNERNGRITESSSTAENAAVEKGMKISIQNWHKKRTENGESWAIIILHDKEGSTDILLPDQFKNSVEVFKHKLSSNLMDLKFTGCERKHVLVILDIKQKSLTEEETTKVLAATTRAQSTLTIWTTNSDLREFLAGVRDNAKNEHTLLKKSESHTPDAFGPFTMDNYEKVIPILVQIENGNTIESLMEKCKAESSRKLLKLCAVKILRQLVGKRKSPNFLDKIVKMFRDLNLNKYLKEEEHIPTICRWIETAYERGYFTIVEKFRSILTEVFCDPNKYEASTEDENLLHQACFNGARENIKHALEFAKEVLHMDSNEIRPLILNKLYVTFGASRKETLLEVVARTNKDPECIKLLLEYLKPSDAYHEEHRESIRNTFQICIRLRSYAFIETMLEHKNGSHYFEIFREALNVFTRTMDEDFKYMKKNKEESWCNWVNGLKRKLEKRTLDDCVRAKERKRGRRSQSC